MQYITEPQRQIPICEEVDLCVIGGSCTGLFAAVRAARLGLRVALIEKQNCLGGMATAGLVNIWHSLHDFYGDEQIIGGLTFETIQRLEKNGAVMRGEAAHVAYRLNTEELKLELDNYVRECGISVYFHTYYCAPVVEDNKITHIMIENKSGRQAIRAGFFIDASGDGDMAVHLGLKSYQNAHIQPPTPCYHLQGDTDGLDIEALLQAHGAEFGLREDWGWSSPIPGLEQISLRADTHVFDTDCADANALTKSEIEGRRQIGAVLQLLRKYGGKKLGLTNVCAQLGIRETRHFVTKYKVTQEDILTGRQFEDAIGYGTYRVDMHHSDSAGISFLYLDGTMETHHDRTSPPVQGRWREEGEHARFYQIPFRMLVQETYKNFIPVGRMLHADEGAFGALRVMVNLNQMGEAAGVAAYCCVNGNKAVQEVDTAQVRRLLKDGGSLII